MSTRILTITFLIIFGCLPLAGYNGVPTSCAPSQPGFGANVWNVSAFSGMNNFNPADFKGFYQTKGEHNLTQTGNLTTFFFNTALDGWSPAQSPANALAANGALKDYNGCPVPSDGFSIRAQRKGFPCGFYWIVLKNLENFDGFKLKLDHDGDGVFEQELSCGFCNGAFLGGGFLGPDSRVEIDAWDNTGNFNLDLNINYVVPVSVPNPSAKSICPGESVNISVAGSENYTWAPATGLNTTTGKQVTATPSVTTTYQIMSSVAGCRDTVYVPITVRRDTVQRDSFVCHNSLATNTITKVLKNSIGCDSVVILNIKLLKKDTTLLPVLTRCNPADTLTKIMTLKNTVGCDSIVIQRFKLAAADTIRRDSFVCSPFILNTIIYKHKNQKGCDSFELVSVKLLKRDTTYLPLIGRCSPADTMPTFTTYTAQSGCDSLVVQRYFLLKSDTTFIGTYTCLAKDTGSVILKSFKNSRGCDSIIIKRVLLRPISVAVRAESPRCYGESTGRISILSAKNGQPPYRYSLQNATFLINQLPLVESNLAARSYTLTVRDSQGCSTTQEVVVEAPPQLTMAFLDDLPPVKLGDSILLSPQINFTAQQWQWSPNENLSCDKCPMVVVKPKATTHYRVTAYNPSGCSITKTIRVVVDDARNVFIPNSFSPNGDGVNDRLTIYSDQTVERVKEFKVFNRWGSKIFENYNFNTNDENMGWDGTFNGKTLEANTYVCYCVIVFKDGKEQVLSAECTLFR